MKISDMKLGVRLGASFGLILLLMLAIISVNTLRLRDIDALNVQIIDNDWVSADAALLIGATTRHTTALLLELVLTEKQEERNAIKAAIANNKNITAKGIGILQNSLTDVKGRAMLDLIADLRQKYIKSFTHALELVDANQRTEATGFVLSDTMPILGELQAAIQTMSDHEKDTVNARGSQIKEHIAHATQLMLVLGAIGILIGVALAYWVTKSITRPISYALKVAQAVARGDLTTRIRNHRKDEPGLLLGALQEMNDNLSHIVSQVRQGTASINVASGEIATGNQHLSARTEAQAGNLEETASAMEQISSTVNENTDNAMQARQLAQAASDVAIKGGGVVEQVVATMSSIDTSSRKIAEIISVIDGIAFQTNILALNAAVEAARAGEQGRGFAVVASEVRGLAQRSAGAAKEIKQLINDSMTQVNAGSHQVTEAGTTMREVVKSVQRVAEVVREISVATEEQSRGIGQVSQAIIQMDDVTQQNAALVEQAAAAASAMHDQAHDLERLVSQFRLDHPTLALAM